MSAATPAARARRQATTVAAVAATVPTILAAEGMTSLAVDQLGFPLVAAAGLAGFLELALIASALLARAAALAGRPGGADAVAVWAVSATSGALSGVHELVTAGPAGASVWSITPGSVLAGAVRVVAPLVAAWLWERVLRASRAEQAERTIAEVRRDRRLLAAARAALVVRRLAVAGKGQSRAAERAARRLDRAHLAALRVSRLPPVLSDVLAAVGQVDHLPAATIVEPVTARPALSGQVAEPDTLALSGQVRAAAQEWPDTITAQVGEDDVKVLPLAGQMAEGGQDPDGGPDTLDLAVAVVRADPSVSGARMADELTRRGRQVSARSGQRWRSRALSALAGAE